jgi:hypothetical protein
VPLKKSVKIASHFSKTLAKRQKNMYNEYIIVEKGSENMGSFSSVRDGDILYLFFEKSDGLEDWVNNLSYRAVPYGRKGDEWYCHEGFLRVWREILPYLEELLSRPSVRRVITVGYSHGAAVALLCHEYVWFTRPDIADACETYGFGCPRVVYGTVPHEGERWRSFYLVRNVDDAITHLPPRFLGYRHVGRLIEIGESGKYSGIDAHRSENYIAELKNAELRIAEKGNR